MLSFKQHHFEKEIILMLVRWYVAYSLSYRDVEELALERGLNVDHSTINRWVIRYAPELEMAFRKKHKRPVGASWRMDETYSVPGVQGEHRCSNEPRVYLKYPETDLRISH